METAVNYASYIVIIGGLAIGMVGALITTIELSRI